jgi:DNA gyrase subunit B
MFICDPGWNLVVADYCLHPDTEVECLGGRKTIKEVVNLVNDGKEIWTYCYRFDKKRIGLQKVTAGSKTGSNREVWKVTLDSGETVVATPEHKFMRRDGTYVELKNLQIGDSLMPFYSDYVKQGGKAVYRRINKSGSYGKIFEQKVLAEDILGLTKEDLKGFAIHHKDGLGVNNLPENLQIMTQSDHYSFHRKNESEEVKQKAARGSWSKSEEGRKVHAAKTREQWAKLSVEDRKLIAERDRKSVV